MWKRVNEYKYRKMTREPDGHLHIIMYVRCPVRRMFDPKTNKGFVISWEMHPSRNCNCGKRPLNIMGNPLNMWVPCIIGEFHANSTTQTVSPCHYNCNNRRQSPSLYKLVGQLYSLIRVCETLPSNNGQWNWNVDWGRNLDWYVMSKITNNLNKVIFNLIWIIIVLY